MNARFIPVLFEGASISDIPIPYQGVAHYRPTTKAGYDELYRRLTDQPLTPKGELGKLRRLPPRERKQDIQNNNQAKCTLVGHEWPVESVAISSDRQTLASGGTDNMIKVWDLHIFMPIGFLWCSHTFYSSTLYLSLPKSVIMVKCQRAPRRLCSFAAEGQMSGTT